MSDKNNIIKENKGLIQGKEKQIYNIYSTNNSFEAKNKDLALNFLKIKRKRKRKNKYKEKIRFRLGIRNKVRNYETIFKLLIINILIIQILCGLSSITLKILGIGDKSIFNFNTTLYKKTFYPKEVYINDEKQSTVKYSYYFNQTENYVKLIWNTVINNCQYIFYQCQDIIEIDVSKFDTSKLVRTNHMFTDCISLTSINLKNFILRKFNI